MLDSCAFGSAARNRTLGSWEVKKSGGSSWRYSHVCTDKGYHLRVDCQCREVFSIVFTNLIYLHRIHFT